MASYSASILNSYSRQTHCQILVNGLLPEVTMDTDILLAYSKCGLVKEAHRVFDKMSERNMHSWNIMVDSYVANSMFDNALNIFYFFLEMGYRPDHFTLPPVIKAASRKGDMVVGRMVHTWVVKLGYEQYSVVGCSLLDLYGNSVDLPLAHQVFSSISWRDSVTWNSMIVCFVRAGCYDNAIIYFRKMLNEGVEIDSRTFPVVLNACGREGDLRRGKEIHRKIIHNTSFSRDVVIGNALIDMYARCGCLLDSEKVFTNMHELNLISWTTMISCYGIHGKGEQSLFFYEKMQSSGLKPNCVTLTALLASCSHSGLIDQGRRIFESISLKYGIQPSVEHYACMVDLLARSGFLEEALELVNAKGLTDVGSIWGALLAGCVMHKNVIIGEVAAHHLFKLEPHNSSNYKALCAIYDSLHIMDRASKIKMRMEKLGIVTSCGCSWVSTADGVRNFHPGDFCSPLAYRICENLHATIRDLQINIETWMDGQ